MNYWFDMDGVLVQYDRDGYTGQNPKYLQLGSHYFRDLKPDSKAIQVLKILSERNKNKIFILTTISNLGSLYMEQMTDKIAWLRKYCPFLNIQTQFIPAVSSKRDIVEAIRKPDGLGIGLNDVLIDDWNTNLNEWTASGGLALKYLNGINSPNENNKQVSYQGINLTEDMSAEDIVALLDMITATALIP